MPTYSGNLINNANVADSLFADNEYKSTPLTRFGTRQIQRITVYTAVDIKTDYMASDSIYSQLVRALQQNVELYATHFPDYSFLGNSFFGNYGQFSFQVDIALDTASDGWNNVNSSIDDNDPADWYYGQAQGNPMAITLTDVIRRALADSGNTDNTAQVLITWTTGDTTWPTDSYIINHGDGSGLEPLNVNNQVKPTDTHASIMTRLIAWAKSL
jgi:hypothetical protein